MRSPWLILLLAAGAGLTGLSQAQGLQAGDRWIALGDSITHHGSSTRYIELFYLTRHPRWNFTAANGGSDGDTASNAVQRISWDIAPEHPTVVSVLLGMNDIDRDLYQAGARGPDINRQRRRRIDHYESGLRDLVRLIRRAGARVILLSPSPFDNTEEEATRPDSPDANAALAECARRSRIVAAELHCAWIDLHGPLTDLNLAQQVQDPQFTIVSRDRIHPAPMGNLAIAYLFLEGQGAPALVARAAVEAKTGRVSAQDNCHVTGVRSHSDGVEFEYLADALPFPVESAAAGILALVPFTAQLNQETLEIGHLPAGLYEVTIDSQPIGRFFARDLGTGVNLANCHQTPQWRQATEVDRILREKNVVEMKLRNIAWVEHTALNNVPQRADATKLAPLFAAQLTAYPAGSNAAREVAEAQRQFLDSKPLEESLRRQRDALEKAAVAAAQPAIHHVSVRRL